IANISIVSVVGLDPEKISVAAWASLSLLMGLMLSSAKPPLWPRIVLLPAVALIAVAGAFLTAEQPLVLGIIRLALPSPLHLVSSTIVALSYLGFGILLARV